MMLGERIKQIRKEKGFTQEELAVRLNVVRQTVSKWEKNLSVPDAFMLQKIADVFEIDVCILLGGNAESSTDRDEIVQQLARINEQLAGRNRRHKIIWKTVGIVLLLIFIVNLLIVAAGIVPYKYHTDSSAESDTQSYSDYYENTVDET